MGNVHRIRADLDIHGNEIRIARHVLRSIGEQGTDEIVCLGDVATLVWPPAKFWIC